MMTFAGFNPSQRIANQWLTTLTLAATVALAPTSSWGIAIPAEQAAVFTEAKTQYDKGNVQAAIDGFQKVVSNAQGNDEANLWMAKALMKQGGEENYVQAKTYLIQALTANADNAEALMHLGTITGWDPSRRPQAIKLLTRALKLKGRSPEVAKESVSVTQNLVQLLMWDGRYMEAAQFAEPIRQEFAKTPASQAVYASLLSHMGKAPLAVPLYESYIKPFDVQPPTTQSLQWQLDYLYALRYADQQPKARQLFGQVQKGVLANGDANLLNSLGGVAYDLNEFMTSIALTEKLPDAMRMNRDVQLRNARAHIKLQQWPEAISTFDNLYQLGELSATEKLEFAEVFRGQNLPDTSFPKTRYIDGLFRDVASNPKYENDADIQPRLKAYFDSLNQNNSVASAPEPVTRTVVTDTRSSGTTEMATIKPGSGRSTVSRPSVRMESSRQQILTTDPSPSWQSEPAPYSAQSDETTWQSKPYTPSTVESTTIQRPTVTSRGYGYRSEQQASSIVQEPSYYQTTTSNSGPITIQSDNSEWSHAYNAPIERKTEGREVATPRPTTRVTIPAKVLEIPNNISGGSVESRIETAKQLSYDRKYGQSFSLFDGVLKEDPTNRDARLGKAMALLYSGRKFQAKSMLTELHSQFPADPEITTSMAELYQMMGRNDKALALLRDLEPGGVLSPRSSSPKPYRTINTPPEYTGRYLGYAAPIDFSQDIASNSDAAQIEADLATLNSALDALNSLQTQSEYDLQKLKGDVWDTRQAMTEQNRIDVVINSPQSRLAPRLVDTATPMQREADAYLYSQTMTDTQDPSATTLPPYLNDRLSNLQNQLYSDLRPELRVGYAMQTQDGNINTNKMNIWQIPVQASVSLTPGLRLRGGIMPQHYALPKANVSPDSNFGLLYSLGGNARLNDRITADADFGLLQLTQSNNLEFNYRARLILDPWDRVRFQLGSKRLTLANSFLSASGFKPSAGAFSGDKLGPANETSIFAELNLVPFTNVDANVVYELGFIGGHNLGSNTKNQIFASTGYTHRFNDKHWARLGYQFLWMNFDKGAINGYFDTTSFGGTSPVTSMNPSVLSSAGNQFGGYFSPGNFFLNAARLDYHGSAFDRFLEYQLGGSLGYQSYSTANNIADESPGSIAYSADAGVRLNWTDWLSSYGRFNFMDSGGIFTRYRFEGGLIIRPYIQALSPVFGEKTPKDDSFRRQDSKFPFNYDIHNSYY